jgi:hypothetical protein
VVVVDYYWAEPLTLGAGPTPPAKRKAVMGGRQSPRAFIVLYTLGPVPLITDDECKGGKQKKKKKMVSI